jgi:hypothetical protein
LVDVKATELLIVADPLAVHGLASLLDAVIAAKRYATLAEKFEASRKRR